MKNYKPLILLGGLGVIGYALWRYYKRQVDFLKDITYQVYNVKVVSISKEKVTLTIWAKIYNASNVEAVVKEMFLDFYVNDVKVGNVTEVKDIRVAPSQTSLINFNFSFNPTAIGKNIVDLISLTLKAKDANLEFSGYVAVESGGLSATLPFEYKNNLKNLLKK